MNGSPTTNLSPPRGTYLLASLFFLVGPITGALLIPPVFYALGWNPARGLIWQDGLYWVLAAGIAWLALVCVGVVAMSRAHFVARGALLAMCVAVTGAMLLAPAGNNTAPTTMQKLYRGAFALPLIVAAVWLLQPKYRRACADYRKASGR